MNSTSCVKNVSSFNLIMQRTVAPGDFAEGTTMFDESFNVLLSTSCVKGTIFACSK